eukprot:CAMPEP_0172386522 /NCGR_PEP_ID=MMETSP1061-20121228/4035_1 /TAXON_ID=37318 /ORGANISM="Pseudo-nitzschia pungens, Strain cf. pungens" /LENGTH=680 /DNA_ID=CAMNT_0013115909 /DNA_START=392 /DNA_END=2434 /DNA_ORIENTATION=+
MQQQQQQPFPYAQPVPQSLPAGDDADPSARHERPRTVAHRSRSVSANSLDNDLEDDFLHGKIPPPPSTPPPVRRKVQQLSPSPRDVVMPSSPRRQLKLKQQQQQQQQQQMYPQDSQPQHHSDHHRAQIHSGLPPNPPKKGKPTSKSSSSPSPSSSTAIKQQRPPKTPNTPPRSKSAEYGSRLESFHQVMLENIEQEALLIKRQGSFQIHQKHLDRARANQQQQPMDQYRAQETVPDRATATPNRKHSQRNSHPGGSDVESLLKETMHDISTAAASTMKSLQSAIQQTRTAAKSKKIQLPAPMACVSINPSDLDDFDESGTRRRIDDDDLVSPTGVARAETEKNAVPSMDNIRSPSGTELMKRMHDAFRKVVVDATQDSTGSNDDDVQRRNDRGGRRGDDENNNNRNSQQDWGVGTILANGFGWDGDDDDDDQRSRATYDTWDDENSVLRRLGSWGTINSQFTAGTAGTMGTLATIDTDAGPTVASGSGMGTTAQNGDEMVIPQIKDDDGQVIDPILVERAQRKKQQKPAPKKRKPRRKKVVKFDYPPIKSLRQYTRPDPEDLPNLFFTEDELDQIEDDRYSTMSTDDIEIVAVASKDTLGGEEEEAPVKQKSSKQDYEPGFKPVKGRSGTPLRRRPRGGGGGGEEDSASKDSGGQDSGVRSPRRLVKGVQIYLRERSTGA